MINSVPLFPGSDNYSFYYCPYSSAFSRMPYKQNHTVCSLLGLAYFIQHNAFERSPCFCENQELFLKNYFWIEVHVMDVLQFVHMFTVDSYCLISHFWQSGIEFLRTFMYKFLCGDNPLFQSDCSSLHSHQQYMSIEVALHPWHYFIQSDFFLLIWAFLIDM